MKNNEPEQKLITDAELDAALAQMAEETPPMPADFHDRWMNAVRAEAKEAAKEPAEESVPKRAVSIVRWTRILSVAAVFVFLIGGTLLYRSTKKTLGIPLAAERREAAEAPAAEEAEEAADTGAAYEVQAMKAAGAVQNSYVAAAGEAPAEAAEWEAEEAAEADYAADASSYDAAMPVPTAMPTAVLTAAPTATAALTPEPTAVPAPAEEPEPEQAGFLPAAGAFFTDMGDFLLAALPYLLVLAVPAAAALIIRKRKGRKS